MTTIQYKGWFVYCLSALINDHDICSDEYCTYSAEDIVVSLHENQRTGFAKEIDDDVRMYEITHPDLGVITFNVSRFTEISINGQKVITIEQGHSSDEVMGVFNWIPGKNRSKNAAFLARSSESYNNSRFEGWPEIK